MVGWECWLGKREVPKGKSAEIIVSGLQKNTLDDPVHTEITSRLGDHSKERMCVENITTETSWRVLALQTHITVGMLSE